MTALLGATDTSVHVIEAAIEPKSRADQNLLVAALQELAAKDPTFGFSIDPESGKIILKSISAQNIEIKVDTLKRTYKIDATVGAPQVAYRETLSKPVTVDYTHKKQTGGSGQY